MNAWEFIAPMVLGVVLVVTAGAVILLRPVSKRLGELLELMIEDRRKGERGGRAQLDHLAEVVETVQSRLALIEERQDFTDALLGRGEGEPVRLPRPAPREGTVEDR